MSAISALIRSLISRVDSTQSKDFRLALVVVFKLLWSAKVYRKIFKMPVYVILLPYPAQVHHLPQVPVYQSVRIGYVCCGKTQGAGALFRAKRFALNMPVCKSLNFVEDLCRLQVFRPEGGQDPAHWRPSPQVFSTGRADATSVVSPGAHRWTNRLDTSRNSSSQPPVTDESV